MREVGEAGHKTSPAACFVPAESERHVGREVGEGGVARRMRCAARIRALCARWKWLDPHKTTQVAIRRGFTDLFIPEPPPNIDFCFFLRPSGSAQNNIAPPVQPYGFTF